ncbi:LLM class flavin-dependent oxidoreductase [Streptomyces similanensis]|uniref:Luciferase-like domain-containing protein n=2 Tax=Streptomyces TaxID=1883 RepID=A0ABP9LHV8_9ACTN
MTVRPPRRMHLAAYLPGTAAPAASGPRRTPPGSRTGFVACEDLARTAERGLFDFLLLAEGRRGTGTRGPAGAGRPEPVSVLSALAGVTERLGLAATADPAFDEPYELARRLATLDHLSDGRAAWNTAVAALTGEDARRGGEPGRADRCARTAEFVATARELWDSWTPEGGPRPFAHRGRHFDIAGEFTVPRPPQGHPVVIQAGDSEEERESAAASADVVLTRPRTLRDAQAFYADVKGRLARHGRAPGDLRILQGAHVVLGDSQAQAVERAAALRAAARPAYAAQGPPVTGPVPAPRLTRHRDGAAGPPPRESAAVRRGTTRPDAADLDAADLDAAGRDAAGADAGGPGAVAVSELASVTAGPLAVGPFGPVLDGEGPVAGAPGGPVATGLDGTAAAGTERAVAAGAAVAGAGGGAVTAGAAGTGCAGTDGRHGAVTAGAAAADTDSAVAAGAAGSVAAGLAGAGGAVVAGLVGTGGAVTAGTGDAVAAGVGGAVVAGLVRAVVAGAGSAEAGGAAVTGAAECDGGAGGPEPLVFAGTPEAVAAELAAFVRRAAVDGFVLVPYPVPGAGLDDFVDRVVPLLQRAGAFRTHYEGATLRSHLGLATRPHMEGLIT